MTDPFGPKRGSLKYLGMNTKNVNFVLCSVAVNINLNVLVEKKVIFGKEEWNFGSVLTVVNK